MLALFLPLPLLLSFPSGNLLFVLPWLVCATSPGNKAEEGLLRRMRQQSPNHLRRLFPLDVRSLVIEMHRILISVRVLQHQPMLIVDRNP
jgi:hypothetical protein